jgi:hypothetical protein
MCAHILELKYECKINEINLHKMKALFGLNTQQTIMIIF